MFNRNKKKSTSKNTSRSHNKPNPGSINMISEGTKIKGTVSSENDIRISGQVEGETLIKGKIIISSGGLVDGIIKTHDADISGTLKGEIYAEGNLIIRSSAVIEGDIYTHHLQMEDGAEFNGNCYMSEPVPSDKQDEADKSKTSFSDDMQPAKEGDDDEQDIIAA